MEWWEINSELQDKLAITRKKKRKTCKCENKTQNCEVKVTINFLYFFIPWCKQGSIEVGWINGWKEGRTYNAIGTWEKDAETEQTEQWPTDHPEDTESSLKVKYTTRGLFRVNGHPNPVIAKQILKSGSCWVWFIAWFIIIWFILW